MTVPLVVVDGSKVNTRVLVANNITTAYPNRSIFLLSLLQ
jgi:hypothetical protein